MIQTALQYGLSRFPPRQKYYVNVSHEKQQKFHDNSLSDKSITSLQMWFSEMETI